ncbi:hypothetical protein DVH24_030850 [Malus domestica]|uniref:Uncharacterized protein n=1 Tax=Malus domestica TaxID=3750 RepID=A0A498HGS2_MALDO|nr:hypothetical protein DVH24_030850 [Malus domestica]
MECGQLPRVHGEKHFNRISFSLVRSLGCVWYVGQDGTRRSVPRLVRQKWMERAVPRDRFWVFLRSTSPPGTGLFHVCGTQCFTILRQIYPMSFSKITPSFRPVPSRPVPFRPVPSRPVPSAYQTHP